MAVPTTVTVKDTSAPGTDLDAAITQINNIVASLRLLTAKLDLDAGVTDTNYNALITDNAVTTAPATITNAY